MKTASKAFIIIGLVCSILLIVLGIIGYSQPDMAGMRVYYLVYGIYSLLTSIWSLCAVNGRSKGLIVAAGIFYMPVMLLASIFMFCIRRDSLKK